MSQMSRANSLKLLVLFILERRDKMDNQLMFISINSEESIKNKILICNKKIKRQDLVLNEKQAISLAKTYTRVLKDNKRIDLKGDIVDQLIIEFNDSPYIDKSNYEEILHDLISLFYELKNDTWDSISDDDLIKFMKNSFDYDCFGSMEMLYSKSMMLIEHIHAGHSLESFKED